MNVHSFKIDVKKWLNLNSLFNLVMIVLMLVLIFSPPGKALLIKGLMKVGLFQPEVSEKNNYTVNFTEVTFRDKNGRSVSLSSLKGKVVFINFWATWCPPCIAELPSINELYNKLKTQKDIVFIIADTDNNFERSLTFMAKNEYQLPVYVATTSIPTSMLSNAIPATVVLNKQGVIAFRHDGAADYTNYKFTAFLDKLIKQ